jgi:glycosyltransferase involved in cell wall biosynthesis
MKIGINASFIRKPNTGIGQVTVNFLNELIKQKSKHTYILYLEEDLPSSFVLSENFETRVFLPLWKRDDLIRKIWWERYLLPKKIMLDECDKFFSLYQSTTILPKTIRHLMLVHDIIPRFFPEYLSNSRKKIYWELTEDAICEADKIIANSVRTEKDLIQNLRIDPTRISMQYLDVDEIYKKEISSEKELEVLKRYDLTPGYIYNGGGLELRKNTEAVILAYNFLLEKNKVEHFFPNFPKLVISGKLMPGNSLAFDAERLIKKLNLTQQVKLLGFVPQEDLPVIYKNSALYIFPSYYEGFGLTILEAMNQGAPVITSKKSSLPEVGGDSVLYCDPYDFRDMAMVMKNALLNKDLREALRRRGLERAAKFSWEKFVMNFLNIIE